jgi:hypothetical protein
MIKKTTYLYLSLNILLFASCTKEPESICTDFTFPGEWILTKIEGLSGTTYFPEDGGYINTIEIGDSTWRELINDSLVIESIYTVHYDSTGQSSIKVILRLIIKMQSGLCSRDVRLFL